MTNPRPRGGKADPKKLARKPVAKALQGDRPKVKPAAADLAVLAAQAEQVQTTAPVGPIGEIRPMDETPADGAVPQNLYRNEIHYAFLLIRFIDPAVDKAHSGTYTFIGDKSQLYFSMAQFSRGENLLPVYRKLMTDGSTSGNVWFPAAMGPGAVIEIKELGAITIYYDDKFELKADPIRQSVTEFTSRIMPVVAPPPVPSEPGPDSTPE